MNTTGDHTLIYSENGSCYQRPLYLCAYDSWVEIDMLPLLRSRTGAGSWANMTV